jgi:UDP-N-acetylglucosamine acyltransferase
MLPGMRCFVYCFEQMSMVHIHPTAVIEPGAELGDQVSVGAFSVIGAQVRVGEGTSIGPHCVIEGRTTIGKDNRIFQFSSLGAAPQDKKYAGEPTELHIGDRNTIRECCTFNLGTVQDVGVTRVGDDNWVMAYTHIAHDCQVGNKTIFANSTQLAGHVHVGDWAHAMTGIGTHLVQDVPPFMMVTGGDAKVRGLNLEGLKRRGFSAEQLAAVKRMHSLLYRQSLTLIQAQEAIDAMAVSHPHAHAEVALMSDFLKHVERGIVR